MIDDWNGFADLLANLIEKYAHDLDVDNLPDLVFENNDNSKMEIRKTGIANEEAA